MCHFFETIKVRNGKLLNLEYHQQRVDYTRKFFGFTDKLELKNCNFNLPKIGEFRLKIDYAGDIKSFICKEYIKKELKSFKIVYSDIKYDYKYSNRKELNQLFDEKYDDIIIVKNTLLCDTSIANIALSIDGIWLTPKSPLLRGTTRARMLKNGYLIEKDLNENDLKKANEFAIMNALRDFEIITNFTCS